MSRTILWIGVAAFALTGAGLAVYLNTRMPVTVRADGQTWTLATHAATPAEALREAGLTLLPEDTVWVGDAAVQTPAADLQTALHPGAVIVLQRARPVRLEVAGRAQLIRTQAVDPAQILSTAGVLLYPGDEIWVDGARWEPGAAVPVPPAQIVVRRAVTISIQEGASTFTLHTAARTVGEAVWQSGERLYQADVVQPPLGTLVTPELQVTITRARAFALQADGRTLTARASAATVGGALAEIGVPLVGLDYAVPAADQPVPAGQLVRVVRVHETVMTEQSATPRDTVYQALPDTPIDTVRQLQAGADGLVRRYVRVRVEEGVEVSRTVEAETVAQAAAPRVIGYGTLITPQTLATPDGPVEYWRAYTMYATSYSASRAGTPRTARNYGHTASGKLLTKGMVAIDRTLMPFGTRMYVPGYGFAVAEDTGGGVKGRFIDLGYDDDNYQHWGGVVMVYFLTPVPPAAQIRWIIPATVP